MLDKFDRPQILYKINSLDHDFIFTSLHDLKIYIEEQLVKENDYYIFSLLNDHITVTLKMRNKKTIILWLINNYILMKLNESI
jgi:hypothetical protein